MAKHTPELLEVAKRMVDLMYESDGLAGYNHNGETAHWETLKVFHDMQKAINKAEGKAE